MVSVSSFRYVGSVVLPSIAAKPLFPPGSILSHAVHCILLRGREGIRLVLPDLECYHTKPIAPVILQDRSGLPPSWKHKSGNETGL